MAVPLGFGHPDNEHHDSGANCQPYLPFGTKWVLEVYNCEEMKTKTSFASLTAGAVMLFVVSYELVGEYLIPKPYNKLYRVIENPVMLLVVFSIFSYGRRLAKKRGEDCPL